MPIDVEDRIRKDYKKGMSYREIAKKHRKSFTQIRLSNPKALADRVELLEKRVQELESDKPFYDMVGASVTAGIELRCPNCDERVEWNDDAGTYKCTSCDWQDNS